MHCVLLRRPSAPKQNQSLCDIRNQTHRTNLTTMLEIKDNNGKTIFIAHNTIQRIVINSDQTVAEITTEDKTYWTQNVEAVKSFLSKKSELAQHVSYLTSAIRNLHNLLRARLH